MAGIFAAVVGSSSLIGADKQGTFERLETHRSHCIYPKIAEHNGRIRGATGDNLLVEFVSASEAVRCAVEMQRGIAARNTGIAPDQRVAFRVGIDEITAIGGDLVSRAVAALPVDTIATLIKPGTAIHGDSGNVAVRLAALADPGGICISGTVWDAVRDQVPYKFEDSGKQNFEIGATPVRCYTMRANALEKQARVAAQKQRRSTTRDEISAPAGGKSSLALRPILQKVLLTTALVFTIAVWIAGGWAFLDSVHHPPSNLASSVAHEPAIIAKPAEPVRVEAAAIEHPSPPQAQLPPEPQSSLTPPRATQESVTTNETRRVVADSEVVDPAARELIMHGWALYYLPYTFVRWQEARLDFQRALELDAQSSEARIGLASILSTKLADGWSPVLQEDMPRAEQLLLEAIDKGDAGNRAAAHYTLGVLYQVQNRLSEARKQFELAISLDPNSAKAYLHLGKTLLYLGDPQAAIPRLEQAIRLNPDDPNIAMTYWALGSCQLLLGRVDQAIDLLETARAANPRLWVPCFYLAGAYGLKGDIDRARSNLAESIRLKPALRSLSRMRAENSWLSNPQYWALQENTLNLGLQRAGLPVQ